MGRFWPIFSRFWSKKRPVLKQRAQKAYPRCHFGGLGDKMACFLAYLRQKRPKMPLKWPEKSRKKPIRFLRLLNDSEALFQGLEPYRLRFGAMGSTSKQARRHWMTTIEGRPRTPDWMASGRQVKCAAGGGGDGGCVGGEWVGTGCRALGASSGESFLMFYKTAKMTTSGETKAKF